MPEKSATDAAKGLVLGNLGSAYAYLGEGEKAKEYLLEAIAIFEEIKDPRAEQVRNTLERLDTNNSQQATNNEQPPVSLP